jgi:hypothetical protein
MPHVLKDCYHIRYLQLAVPLYYYLISYYFAAATTAAAAAAIVDDVGVVIL